MDLHVTGRHSGKTSAVVTMALADPHSVVVVCTGMEAERLHRLGVPRSQIQLPIRFIDGQRPSLVIVDDADYIARDHPRFWMDLKTRLDRQIVAFASRWPGSVLDFHQDSALGKLVDYLKLGPRDRVQEDRDFMRQAFKYTVTLYDEQIRVGYNVTEQALIHGGLERVARSLKRRIDLIRSLPHIDVVKFAVDFVGFAEHEMAGAELRVQGDGLVLDVKVADSEWEPVYDVAWDEMFAWLREQDLPAYKDAVDLAVNQMAAQTHIPVHYLDSHYLDS